MNILTYPNNILESKCKPIKDLRGRTLAKITNMFRTMYNKNGIGLSANQIGWNARIFVMKVSDKSPALAFINPEIIWKSEQTDIKEEGCLSVPGTYVDVERHTKITLRYRDTWWNEIEREFHGLQARCIQHEIDHLDGICRVKENAEKA